MLYYFAHPTNMRVMRDVIKMRQREGAAGYGVYMMLLEFLRDSDDSPVYDDPDAIAFAINEQDTALISRIIHDYSLFKVTDDAVIISPFLAAAKKEAEQAKARAREFGRMGAKARYHQDNPPHHNPDHAYSVPNNADSTPIPPPIEGLAYNQNNQPKDPTNVGEKKPTKSKLVGMEWLGLPGEDWLDLCRSSPVMTIDFYKQNLPDKPRSNHNHWLLDDWIRKFGCPKELFRMLTLMTDDWRVDHPAFAALNKVRLHVQETQYKPAHPWEYLIYNAINFYNVQNK